MDAVAGLPVEPSEGPTLCRTPRRILGRVRALRVEDVVEVLAECQRRGWTVHPISTGKNWGMGSHLPARDDALVLDLSALRGIGPVDRAAGSVRIESGVTQRDLADWLAREAPEFALNPTGSGQHTSLLGCALERGFGYAGSRADELFGLEVALADGTCQRPAPLWFSTTGHVPAGPAHDALFAQSGLGVVTAAWIRLRRKQPVEAAVLLEGEGEAVFASLVAAYRHGVLTLPTHAGGGARAAAVGRGLLQLSWGREPTAEEVTRVFPPRSGHVAIAALHGTPRLVRTGVRELRRLAAPGVAVRAVTAGQLTVAERWLRRLRVRTLADRIAAVRPLLALCWGEPSDAGLAAIAGWDGQSDDLDRTAEGCIYFNVISPVEAGASFAIEHAVAARWPRSALTRCFLDASTLVHVFSLFFEPAEAAVAHAAADRFSTEFTARGWPPYRLAAWSRVERPLSPLEPKLRTAFDPQGTLRTGVYAR